MSDSWAWISGWGIRPERFQAVVESAFPQATHRVFAPEPGAVEAVLTSGASNFGAYSLGSLLLLEAIDRIPASAKILCVAPVLAFCEEAGMGGTTPLASLQTLQAKLAKNPAAALKLFYRLANLLEEPTGTLPYSAESLHWGLDMLATRQVPPVGLDRVEVILGKQDRLLDVKKLLTFFERKTVIDSQHDYRALFSEHSVLFPHDRYPAPPTPLC